MIYRQTKHIFKFPPIWKIQERKEFQVQTIAGYHFYDFKGIFIAWKGKPGEIYKN